MATITRENIAPLNDKLTVILTKEDYLPAVEKSIKSYAKTANIQGFRKGMVPAGLVRKMYGQGVLNEEVIKRVDAELNKYVSEEKLAILAQPIALEQKELNLDINSPEDYTFEFEIGLQPEFNVDLKNIDVTRYNVEITDKMLDEEIDRLQSRFGNYTTPESIENEDTIISATIAVDGESEAPAATETEADAPKPNDTAVNLKDIAKTQQKEFTGKKVGDTVTVQLDKAFKGEILDRVLTDLKLDKADKANGKKSATLTITKLGLLEKAPLEEAFFNQVYPGRELKEADAFRTAIKDDLTKYYGQQASSQIHDQIYHYLTEQVKLDMPEPFLKRWMMVSSDGKKSNVEIDAEYGTFTQQLQWALISSKLSSDNNVNVENEELKDFARHQLMGYLGGQMELQGNEPWIEEYVSKMMADKKFIDDAYGQIRISKLFEALEPQVKAKDESISEAAFTEMLQKHQHEHEHGHDHDHGHDHNH